MSALTDCYARPSTPFGQLGPFYDDLGHRGKDYGRGARAQIIAYDDMIIDSIFYSAGLGWCVGLKRLTMGGYAGYAHTYGIVGGIGTIIRKRGTIALVAGSGDNPGTLWDGPHIHTTESWVSAFNAAAGIRPLSDPGPAIARATGSSTAGGDSTPLNQDEGQTMFPLIVRKPNGQGDIYTIGQEYLKYERNGPNADVSKNIMTGDDKFHTISEAQFPGVLASFGVPSNVPNIIRSGPVDVWSRAREINDKLDKLVAVKVEQV